MEILIAVAVVLVFAGIIYSIFKKKKKEEVAVDTCKPKLEKAYLAGELLVSSIYNVYGVDTTSIEEDETTGEQIERTYKVVTPAMAAAIEKFRRDRA